MRGAWLAALLLSGCPATASAAEAGTDGPRSNCPPPPRLVGARRVPASTLVGADPFGGISGLDYDAARRRWWLVSDDRGERAPMRFFSADLRLRRRGITRLALGDARHLAGPGTTPAPELIDAEALRVDPGGDLLLASEGDAALGIGHWIRRYRTDGRMAGEVPLPAALRTDDARGAAAKSGPRANRSIEGLALTRDGRRLWIALEAPLLQDGPVASPAAGANLRLTRMPIDASPRPMRHDPGSGFQQFVYAADASLPHEAGESSDNGISEILAVDGDTLLVLERSGRQDRAGGFRFRSRLYCAEVAGATDVALLPSLEGSAWRPMRKRLLLDFSALPDGDANFEAMAWGPAAARGRRWLVVASDNNFFAGVPTVVLAFEVRSAAR